MNAMKNSLDTQIVKVSVKWNLQIEHKNYVFLLFVACSCDANGSNGDTCDNDSGNCSCKLNISGKKCDQCVDGLYGFPKCQGRFLSSIFLKQIYFPLILQ